MEHYLSVISDAFEAGVMPRCHLEDITRADFYGFVVPFVKAIQDLAEQANMPVRIRACDTLGYGIPYGGVAMPRSLSSRDNLWTSALRRGTERDDRMAWT